MSERKDDMTTLLFAALVVVAVIGGGLFFAVRKLSAMRAMAEEQRAKAMQMEAQVRVQTAMAESEAIKAAGETPPGENVTIREALDKAAAKLEDGSMNGTPAAAATLHGALGESYLSINELDAAEKHFNAALQLHIKAGGENDPAVAKDRENLARVAQRRGG